jgi:hypothetical protein
MAEANSKPWRVLALRANVHLGAARLLLDEALEEAQRMPDATATQLRGAQAETVAAQDLVRHLAGGAA